MGGKVGKCGRRREKIRQEMAKKKKREEQKRATGDRKQREG